MKIPLVNLKAQYDSIKEEVDKAIKEVIENTSFIMGKHVQEFDNNFANYFNVKQHLISSNINYFYMYYQNDNNNKESYDKSFDTGLNKINKIIQEITSFKE